jgi:hypothetical protein
MSEVPSQDENYSQIPSGSIVQPPPFDSSEYKPYFSLLGVESQLNMLLGDILTIMDALHADTIQRKALKDIVKQKFWDRMNFLRDIFYRENPVPDIQASPKEQPKA